MCENLAEAFDRINDFNSIHLGRTQEDAFIGAIRCLQESVGLDDQTRELLATRLQELPIPEGCRGGVLLGVVIGLMAAQLATESDGEVAVSG